VEKYIPDAAVAEQGMTLWQIIKAGGEVMILLAFLSIAALGLIVYYFLTIKQDNLIPEDFQENVISLVEAGRFDEARKLSEENENLIANVVIAGLLRKGREKIVIKEAIQDEGKRSIDDLRQKLSYLADVAVISPMVGLLGTVLGMIQAFNVIAFQTGAVKPILLASGISKAMVTTAAGLMIAIPAMIFYSFFRGKVQNVTSHLENVSTELFNLITEEK
jgi:biopolymer transport protein ExbB